LSLPEFKPVKSSNVAAVGHDGDALYVKFHSGDIWRYPGVSTDEHQQLLTAQSVGSHYHRNVKAKYSGTKVS
jgi:hypothetical protein